MKTPEMTEEIKHDLKVLKYRDVIDGKTFYKSDNSRKLPKHFQVGSFDIFLDHKIREEIKRE